MIRSTVRAIKQKTMQGDLTDEQTGYEQNIDIFQEDVSNTPTRERASFVHCLHYKKLPREFQAYVRKRKVLLNWPASNSHDLQTL